MILSHHSHPRSFHFQSSTAHYHPESTLHRVYHQAIKRNANCLQTQVKGEQWKSYDGNCTPQNACIGKSTTVNSIAQACVEVCHQTSKPDLLPKSPCMAPDLGESRLQYLGLQFLETCWQLASMQQQTTWLL